MSDRDEVRGLAREILRLAGPTTHLNYPAQLDDAERRLLAFLAERDSFLPRVAPEAHSAAVYRAEQREAALQAQLHRALGELNLALACQEGLSDQVADLQATVARLEGERDRALGEGAGLRERFQRIAGLEGSEGMNDFEFARIVLSEIVPSALSASPLGERAGAVLRAANRVIQCRRNGMHHDAAFGALTGDELDDLGVAVDALRVELAKGGDDA